LLVLASTLHIALEPAINKRLRLDEGRRRRAVLWRALALGVQFTVSVYGGYFGAGRGIRLLTALGSLRGRDIRQANGLRTCSASRSRASR
jgi:uncharacterized membrane protein YfcA